ncbi:MAG: 4-diphosphocytidyl-2-C-methyl-D-erythritol kinase [Acidobacteriota bacterium]|nr:4-diphosphocytidyl-2-C-methyl-D-erythritol kinase [Acidobacteriota bacterium]
MSQTVLSLPSFAKINWSLRVLGRRADGLHEVRTILQTIDLHDRLRFALGDDEEIHLTCDSPDVPLGARNLIVRAALRLKEGCGIRKGASIHLEKVIPVGAGLGGGSSNAVIALIGLARLWEIEIGKPELSELAAALGADVPYFLTGGTALGIGVGVEIKPVTEVVAKHLIVLNPGIEISTARAYAALNSPALTKAEYDTILSISCADEQFMDFDPDALHNDFEPVIFRQEPEIERARNALLDTGAKACLMAGSGSSVFGVFDNQEAQERAVDALGGERSWRVFRCATLARTEYLTALGDCAAPLKRV